jgi:hypothetical protein
VGLSLGEKMNEKELVEAKETEVRAEAEEAGDIRETKPSQNASEQELMRPGDKVELFSILDIDLTDLNDPEVNEKVRDLAQWVHNTKPEANSYDMILMIQEVKERIGVRPGEENFERVWQYVRLDLERKKIDNELRSMER